MGSYGAILLMIAGMIAYPQLKNKFKASQDAASVVPTSGTSLRNQTLNINASIKYQSLTDKIMSTGSTLPDEEVDLAFESSGKVVAIYFTEGTHVKAGDLLAKINDKPLQAQLKKLEAKSLGQGSCLSPTYLVGERRRQPRGLRASSHRIREANGGYRAGQSEYRPDRASGSFRRDHRTSLRE